MKKFMWRRVVIDKETGKVANENPQGLDANWEEKEVIWTSIEEYAGISQEEVEELFGTAAAAKPVVVEEAPAEEADGEPKPEEPVIREFFEPAGRDKVIPIIKHFPPADRVLLAVDNLDDAQVDVDKLNLLIKQWEPLDVQGLIAEYEQDKEKETTQWHETEKYFIDLAAKKNFEKKVKIWIFHQKSTRDLGEISQ